MSTSEQDLNIIIQDSVRLKTDTLHRHTSLSADSSVITGTIPLRKLTVEPEKLSGFSVDTTATCTRGAISDVTFYDSLNLLSRLDKDYLKGFPYRYIEDNKISEAKVRQTLTINLKEGKYLPLQAFRDDWIIVTALVAGFLYSLIRTFSRTLSKGVIRFFLFRGIGDATSREYGEIFHWQSTILNLTTFINLALFAYCSAQYYDFIPPEISDFMFWLISLAVIIAVITSRHIICAAAGNLSGEKEALNEYVLTIYHSYQYMAMILFVLVILLAYSRIFLPKILFSAGFFSIGALYLMRIIRLALIFIKRNISILYLILYLCALEFLPVLVTLKYFTGLF
jgi:hypothetical protein